MEQLKKNVMSEVKRELDRANKKFPLFNGPHEGYAVILEEAEETEEALQKARERLAALWATVRGNTVYIEDYEDPEYLANEFILVACEAIQTAAMCLKYEVSMYNNSENGGMADE